MNRFVQRKPLQNFIHGMGRVVDLGATLGVYRPNKVYASSGNEADLQAMKEDWEAVGKDLYTALSIYEQEN